MLILGEAKSSLGVWESTLGKLDGSQNFRCKHPISTAKTLAELQLNIAAAAAHPSSCILPFHPFPSLSIPFLPCPTYSASTEGQNEAAIGPVPISDYLQALTPNHEPKMAVAMEHSTTEQGMMRKVEKNKAMIYHYFIIG